MVCSAEAGFDDSAVLRQLPWLHPDQCSPSTTCDRAATAVGGELRPPCVEMALSLAERALETPNDQRLSTAPQSLPKRPNSNAADKPRWTEPPQLKRDGWRDRGLQAWHADACVNYGVGFEVGVGGRCRFCANLRLWLLVFTVWRDSARQLSP